MPTCSATCKDGGACHFKARPGHSVCGKHMTQDREVVVVLCGHRMTNGRPCTNPRAEGHELCTRHQRLVERQQRRRRVQEVVFAALDALWTDNDPVLARQRLFAGLDDGHMDQEAYDASLEILEEDLTLWHALHVMPPNVEPKSDIHRLSLDGQNVHTKEVAGQTNDAMALLIGTDVPGDQNTMKEIAVAWGNKSKTRLKKAVKDMSRWYETESCRADNDQLYKRALDGLWANIRASKFKAELIQRLWEEAEESIAMCCEGHLSRLCNVLVGFDEAFKPEIPVGLLLQQKMAAIAEKEISVEHKVGEAWAVFEELKIPRDQRLDWLEAF